ncbi:flagellar basal body M-ring protein FliF [Citrobacter sp. wls619]|uniref:flagellar basal-body MS-ring/collar protein FliF n=1 Tax=Citrobacter sp. wls619 TaxID=2576432 RepID=UPI0010C9B8CD|nr:flagellar basal-body MS-ring/collar protein FliF [Citrobacter sp. wls619]TKV07852.1 flagellar basal body M-ring protein FliF [Citrobacter sp. wls619]
MSATLNDITNHPADRLKSALTWLRASSKLSLVICSAAAVSVLIALMFWAKEPDYRLLFSNISDEDGGAIVTQLTQMNIPYRIDNTGGTIMIPEAQVHEVRMKLAQQGLPKGGAVGFELLDQEKFGISQFSEQVNYNRALEGELARTIENLGSIRSARVHLAIPKQSMFVREKKQPTASVTVNLIQGRTIDEGQVIAITHLVSSAVTGLTAENVTIVDQRGALLTQNGVGAGQTSYLKYTSEIESDYQQRIQNILSPLVGASNVRAQVTAQIDFTTAEQTQEQYRPNADTQQMAIRSRQSSRSTQGNSQGSTGVPGALSNLPPTPATAPVTQQLNAAGKQKNSSGKQEIDAANTSDPALSSTYNGRNDETTNFEVDRTLTHTKSSIGRIERLSVAVVINHLSQGKEGKVGPLNENELTRINDLVKEAIGYKADRGDSIKILNSPFNGMAEDIIPPLWKQERFYALLIVIARYLAIAIIAWVLWRKLVLPAWSRHQEVSIRRLEMEKETLHEQQAAKKYASEKDARDRAQQRVDTELNTQQLRDLADQDPRIIALVVRQWMDKEYK